MKILKQRDSGMAAHNFAPATVCAALGGYALSSLHRAARSGKLKHEKVGSLLYIEWSSFRSYVGGVASAKLPQTALEALETHHATRST